MQQPSTVARSADAEARAGEHQPRTAPSEDLYLRNYDPHSTYTLTVTVTGEGDEPVFEETYRLRPGQVESVRGVLAPAVYDVTVELDGIRRKTVECRVGTAAEHTIHVEVGNGLVSVTEGLYG